MMLVVLLVVSSLILKGFPVLKMYWETNIALNSLILGVGAITVIQVFVNNFKVFRTALFLKKIQDLDNLPDVTSEEIEEFQRILEKRIHLLNTHQMYSSINNIGRYGQLTFTDQDARLIKSTLGYRVGFMRSSITFNSGILVMLGLLGTFLGLLGTIDAVGQAMNGMSTLGDNFDAAAINNFIGSLSAPLQGMGLAFSSSLFGLSGSLLSGYFSNLSLSSQNHFIETFSRWIDERIPKFDPEKARDAPGNKAPDKDDIRSLFAGFVFMSTKTNKQINRLFYALTTAVQHTTNINRQIDQIAHNQQQLNESMLKVSASFDALSHRGQGLADYVERSAYEIFELRQESGENLTNLQKQFEVMSTNLSDMHSAHVAISENTSQAFKQLEAMREDNKKQNASLSSVIEGSLTHMGSSLDKSLTQMGDNVNSALEQSVFRMGESMNTTMEQSMNKMGDTMYKSLEHSVSNMGDVMNNSLEQSVTKIGDTMNISLAQTIAHAQKETAQASQEQMASIQQTLRALDAAFSTQNINSKELVEFSKRLEAQIAQLIALQKQGGAQAVQSEQIGEIQNMVASVSKQIQQLLQLNRPEAKVKKKKGFWGSDTSDDDTKDNSFDFDDEE